MTIESLREFGAEVGVTSSPQGFKALREAIVKQLGEKGEWSDIVAGVVQDASKYVEKSTAPA